LLRDAFQVEITSHETTQFHNSREIRNKIAHGDPVDLDMKRVIKMGQTLRKLAIKANSHLIEHFFVIERYSPENGIGQ
jgi:hypothetical protein